MRPLPDSVDELLDDLETHYPPKCKDPGESLEQHMFYSGQVTLIAVLRARYKWTRDHSRMDSILKEI